MFEIMKNLGITVCFSPDEPAAGSADGTPTADSNNGAGAEGGAPPPAAESSSTNNSGILASDAAAPEAEQQASEGDVPEEKGSTSEQGKETDQEAQPISFELSEGHEEFKDDFATFADDMNAWLKDNPNASGQQLLQEAANRQASTILQQREDFIKQHNAQIETWEKELKADQQIGGADFEKNMEIAKLARDKFGDDEFKKVLGESGLGSHPALVKIFHLAGKQLQNSPILTGGGVSGGMSLGEALYGGKGKT